MTSKLIKINNSRTAAVNQSVYWIPVDANTPVGVKLQLINRAHGVSTTGSYYMGSDWTHWQGLPKFMDGDKNEN